jgi:hypothetical protein
MHTIKQFMYINPVCNATNFLLNLNLKNLLHSSDTGEEIGVQ